MNEIKILIESLKASICNPEIGLPEDVFLFVSGVTPLVNVDLLIKNGQGRTLLTWRNDGYCQPGWHVPGGIVRFKETTADRIKIVAATELGAAVEFTNSLLAINEIIHPSRAVRGHFISLLYECTLVSPLDEKLRYMNGIPCSGEWAWHEQCPSDIIPEHEIYRKVIVAKAKDSL